MITMESKSDFELTTPGLNGISNTIVLEIPYDS